MNGKELVQFIRNEKGHPVGCFVGKDGWIGWSLCHTKLDRWDRDLAVRIARVRAEKGTGKDVPMSVLEQYNKFYNRCRKYFKDNFKGYHRR